ncbi:cupin domain-containing protein [Vibrio neptunius]|uniref:AraC family transcriptional regulator n=1 Tax=Vibrio neptunius TaxID=170651 RepID=UPI003CE4C1AD
MHSVDPLSLFISHLAPQCEVFSHVQLRAPWGIEENKQDSCSFSFVKEGSCIVELATGSTVQLNSGQLMLLPYGTAHKIMSGHGVRCQNSRELFVESVTGAADIVIGGQGTPCYMMCGCFVFSPIQYWGGTQMSSALPEVIIIDAPQHGKLDTILSWMYEENKTPSAGRYLAQKGLLELLLVEVLRSLDRTSFNPSWLQALHDRFLAPVMLAVQEQLQKDWSLEELAGIAALSKSSFSTRFKQITGISPLNFVRQWRCLVAARLLTSTNLPLKKVASECGFQSPDVLIRNFRQFHSLTPIQFRKVHRLDTPS